MGAKRPEFLVYIYLYIYMLAIIFLKGNHRYLGGNRGEKNIHKKNKFQTWFIFCQNSIFSFKIRNSIFFFHGGLLKSKVILLFQAEPGLPVFADLYNLALEYSSPKVKQQMSLATPIFVDSVYQFLLATLVLSYA